MSRYVKGENGKMARSSLKELSPFHSSSLLHMNIPSCSHLYFLRSLSTLFSSAPFHLSVISISPLRHLHFTSPSSLFHLSVISISPLRHLYFIFIIRHDRECGWSYQSQSGRPARPAQNLFRWLSYHIYYLLIQFLTVMCSGDFLCFKCWRAAVQISNFYSLTNPNLSHLTSFVSVCVGMFFK